MTVRDLAAGLLATTVLMTPAATVAQEAASSPAVATEVPAVTEGATDRGTNYIVPDGWVLEVEDGLHVFTLPEGDTTLHLLEVEGAEDADAAIADAWARIDPDFDRDVAQEGVTENANGWDEVTTRTYAYPPADRRIAQAVALEKDGQFTVVVGKVFIPTAAKRGAQFAAWNQALTPAGHDREDLSDAPRATIDAALIGRWTDFIEEAMADLAVPGAAVAVMVDGKTVHMEGLGVRDVESMAPVDTDTMFMTGSNTKGMTTLLLGTMAADGLIDFEAPVTRYVPDFRLGDAETTRQVKMKHLVCACTGLPRKDYEMIFNNPEDTPAQRTFDWLAVTQPTTEFGELFQYNNIIASAAGYVAGRILHPEMEPGAGYDRAMEERVFAPLGMDDVAFDVDGATAGGNWARPHGTGRDGNPKPESVEMNRVVYPVRPAGALWADIEDFSDYVLNELTLGVTEDGERVMPESAILSRRVPQVAMGQDAHYGMGVMLGEQKGLLTTYHGGTTFGYQSNYLVFPERGVALAMMTNGADGMTLIAESFGRFVELAFGAEETAAADLAQTVTTGAKTRSEFYANLDTTPDRRAVARLVSAYTNPDLGELRVEREGERLYFALPTARLQVATRKEPGGATSFVVTDPSFLRSLPFQLREDGTLVLADAQHEYVYRPSAQAE